MNISQLEDELKELNNKYMELMDEIERIKLKNVENELLMKYTTGTSQLDGIRGNNKHEVIINFKMEKMNFILSRTRFIESQIDHERRKFIQY
jgi:hypothetical protein